MPEGRCRLCGAYKKLSFDHVPPRAAFNDVPVYQRTLGDVIHLTEEDAAQVRGRIQQRGAGGYSLCRECNSFLGQHYVRAYVDLVELIYYILYHQQRDEDVLLGPFTAPLRPLKIIKCIIGMCLSTSSIEFRDANIDLVKFVMNPYDTGLNPTYRVNIFASRDRKIRIHPTIGALDITGKSALFTEIYYWPLGSHIVIEGDPFPGRHFDLTHFADHPYDAHYDMRLEIPVVDVRGPVPGLIV